MASVHAYRKFHAHFKRHRLHPESCLNPGGEIEVATTAAGLDYACTPAFTLTGAVWRTQVSGTGIADNDYDTYALFAKYAFSKRTALYGALDHQRTTDNGTVATVSGKRSNSQGGCLHLRASCFAGCSTSHSRSCASSCSVSTGFDA